MISSWISFFLLALILCLLYLPVMYAMLVWVILFTCGMCYLIYYSHSTHYQNIPRHRPHEVESMLKHGDVIFTSNYHVSGAMTYISKAVINFRCNHTSIIIEENNQKYVIETNKDKLFSRHIFKTYRSKLNNTWNAYKIPLREFLISYPSVVIRIFRNEQVPFVFEIKDVYFEPIIDSYYYCSVLTGHLLEKNGLIPPAKKLFRYRARELISLLRQSGYKGYEIVCA